MNIIKLSDTAFAYSVLCVPRILKQLFPLSFWSQVAISVECQCVESHPSWPDSTLIWTIKTFIHTINSFPTYPKMVVCVERKSTALLATKSISLFSDQELLTQLQCGRPVLPVWNESYWSSRILKVLWRALYFINVLHIRNACLNIYSKAMVKSPMTYPFTFIVSVEDIL